MGHPLPFSFPPLVSPLCFFACPYPVPSAVMSRTRQNTTLYNTSRHFSSLISSMSVEILHPIHSTSPHTRSEERILIHEDWHYGLNSISIGNSSWLPCTIQQSHSPSSRHPYPPSLSSDNLILPAVVIFYNFSPIQFWFSSHEALRTNTVPHHPYVRTFSLRRNPLFTIGNCLLSDLKNHEINKIK